MKLIFGALLIFLYSCTSQSYFKSPNSINKKQVVLYLHNKPAIAGALTVPFEENFNGGSIITKVLRFTPEGKNREEIINFKEVIGYSLDNNYYALKYLFLLTDNNYHWLFAKRLTGENSRIQLYELYETGMGNLTGESNYSYFISLPTYNEYETLSTRSSQLIPDFNVKMSTLVSDCPSLAQKIRDKEIGYFIPVVSLNIFKHKLVMTKIIDEYNNCH